MKAIPNWIIDDNTRLRLGIINKLLKEDHARHAVLRDKQPRTSEEHEEMREINLRINALERAWNYAMPVQPGLPDTRKRFSDREKQILEKQFAMFLRSSELRNAQAAGVSQSQSSSELREVQETIARLDKEYADLQKLR